MPRGRTIIVDGNEAAARIAYKTNEVIAIYPITPASPMGELADAWSTAQQPNLWGAVPDVVEMQSEAGASAAVHGALQAGALATTFTASQGLLLMIPSLYKIAGELTAFCMHVAARTVATHALSIFGDQSDVMACRQTGFALLASGSVQEAHDIACIGQATTLRSRVPFLHFFDGFRTSHEIARIEEIADEDLRALIPDDLVRQHRARALTPDHPVIRGTAQNPDAFFQAREAVNRFYLACPALVRDVMEEFGARSGRHYRLFDYVGHPEAEAIIVVMGSGAETVEETVAWLNTHGRRVGVVKVRLYRPFSVEDFLAALPPTTRGIAVLDKTKEPGAIGEPLYQDVVTALREGADSGMGNLAQIPHVIGGRYGLSSKEFTAAMAKAVFDELEQGRPKTHFTVGIVDDVTGSSLVVDPTFDVEDGQVMRAIFFGLGSDGTVGANKNSLKIIGQQTSDYVQGYFVYDSKKAGAMTVSHLRFSRFPIRSSYLIRQAGFVACHAFPFVQRYDVLDCAAPGAVLLLNAPYEPEKLWGQLPREVQQQIIDKHLELYAIDAYRVARELGLGGRINTIMQTCFFSISGVLEPEEAIRQIKAAIKKTYGKLGPQIVEKNFAAVDRALEHLHRIDVPAEATATSERTPLVAEEAPDFVKRVTAVMMAGKGDLLPVSAFPIDGTWPTGTSVWDKRNIALTIPVWSPDLCVQCNLCVLVCPHAAIRAKVCEPSELLAAPGSFLSTPCRSSELKGMSYLLQVAPEDCTGCDLCVEVCPAKDKTNPQHKAIDMRPQAPIRERERANYAFFLSLPEIDRSRLRRVDARTSQLFEPLFQYSGACAGCGETPYLKLLTQLFGDRALIANATGCSSIYGGNLPTTPYAANREGRGPAWSNSLFEDNAEFGFGLRLGIDSHRSQARHLLQGLASQLGDNLAAGLLTEDSCGPAALAASRRRIVELRRCLREIDAPEARRLDLIADYLLPKSVWLVGGDGWAYDIGYGGLDHVVSFHRNVNVLVLDTEVYSNTGGQQSKATPLGAAARFAAAGKAVAKKDLGMEAMSYGHVYVARVAFGARPSQTVQAFVEAEAYEGPSLIIAYCHCVAHGYDMRHGADQQKLAVACGSWPLYRYDPRRVVEGLPPLKLDSPEPKLPVSEYMRGEARFRMVEKRSPERFHRLQQAAQREARQRFAVYRQLAAMTLPRDEGNE